MPPDRTEALRPRPLLRTTPPPAPGDEAAPAPDSPQDPQAPGSDALVGSQLIAAAPTNEAQPASGDFAWTYTTDGMPAGQCAINGWNNVQPADGVARVPAVAPPSAGAAAGLPVVAIADKPVGGDSPYKNLSASLGISGATSLTTIGDYAFQKCSGLTGTLVLPASLTSIGDGAFWGCSGLTGTLALPASLTSIGRRAFADCSGLTSLDFSSATSLTSLDDYAFNQCTGLTGPLVLPASLTSIGDFAFEGYTGLTGTLTLPASLTSIGTCNFQDCTGLTSLDFSGATSLTSIGVATFSRCTGLTSLDFSGATSLTSFGQSAFQDCSGLTGPLVLPASLTSLGVGAFWGCSGLTSLDFSGATNLTTIGVAAFFGCSSLTSLDLSGLTNLTTIGMGAFGSCTGLTGTLVLPASVSTIGYTAFTGCQFDAVQLPDGLQGIGESAFQGNRLWALPGLPAACVVQAGLPPNPPMYSQHPTGELLWAVDGADNADVLLADGLAEHGIASLDEVGQVTFSGSSILNPNTWRTDGFVRVSRASLEQAGSTLNYTYRRPDGAGGYQALGDVTVASLKQIPFGWIYSADGMPADQCKIVGWNGGALPDGGAQGGILRRRASSQRRLRLALPEPLREPRLLGCDEPGLHWHRLLL